MVTVHGFADTGFGSVADAFGQNFALETETGAACAIYLGGKLVVDLQAGIADRRTGKSWNTDTLVLGFSIAKGLMALCGHLAHQRGLLDFDAKVSTVWPEFAANGKQETLIRDLFTHRAGLIALDRDLTIDDVAGWTPVIHAIEKQKPLWTPVRQRRLSRPHIRLAYRRGTAPCHRDASRGAGIGIPYRPNRNRCVDRAARCAGTPSCTHGIAPAVDRPAHPLLDADRGR